MGTVACCYAGLLGGVDGVSTYAANRTIELLFTACQYIWVVVCRWGCVSRWLMCSLLCELCDVTWGLGLVGCQ
jgi:hypothetical protein